MKKLPCVLFGALIVGSASMASYANAQTQQQVNWCEGKDGTTPDLQINSCTSVIQSGRYSGPSLAIAFSNRGNAYFNKGEYDRAIAECDQAIRLDPNVAVAFGNRGAAYSAKKDYYCRLKSMITPFP